MILEICTDASIRKFQNGRTFGCSGAIEMNSLETEYLISPDSTNNRSELLAVYLGCKLANRLVAKYGINNIEDIILYSDSQFSIFGLTRWLDDWIKSSLLDGIMYSSTGKPVSHQELFKMILVYLKMNHLKIHMRHQLGHVNINSEEALAKANELFKTSNGYMLKPEDIYKISYYNNLIDKSTRDQLRQMTIEDVDLYPKMNYDSANLNRMCYYIIPTDYKYYVL
jgi:ribonuclease HI